MTDERARDVKGRFAKGNSGGPGRPRLETEASYFNAINEGITLDDLKIGAKVLAGKLRRGDLQAWKILLPYLVGLPVQRSEVTGQDGAPISIIEIIRDSTNTAISDEE